MQVVVLASVAFFLLFTIMSNPLYIRSLRALHRMIRIIGTGTSHIHSLCLVITIDTCSIFNASSELLSNGKRMKMAANEDSASFSFDTAVENPEEYLENLTDEELEQLLNDTLSVTVIIVFILHCLNVV